MSETLFDQLVADRSRIESDWPGLHDRVTRILYKHDPMGITFGDGQSADAEASEYASEATTIIKRLPIAIEASEVETIIEQEMSFWFGDGAAHPDDGYAILAREIRDAWDAAR